jgi:hypothetical protein
MAEYPYTGVVGKLRRFMEKLQASGLPPVASQGWLKSFGFTSSNDRSILNVIKFLGFVDGTSRPTDCWQRFKSGDNGALATAVRTSYEALFMMYPDAQARTEDELKTFFGSKTTAGPMVVRQTVSTFKTLCSLADFSADHESAERVALSTEAPDGRHKALAHRTSRAQALGTVVNINIQLTIPEASNEETYDKFFAALRRHLIEPDEKGA